MLKRIKRSIFKIKKRLNIPKKPILPGLILAFVIITVLGLIMIWWLDSEFKRRSATAPAEILSIVPTKWHDGRRRNEGFQINYRFQVNGQKFLDFERTTNYTENDQYRVCYNPDDIADRKLHTAKGADCGKTILF